MLSGKMFFANRSGPCEGRILALICCAAVAGCLFLATVACTDRRKGNTNDFASGGIATLSAVKAPILQEPSTSPEIYEPLAAIGTCSPDGWRLQRQSSKYGGASDLDMLEGIWGSSPHDVFVVGTKIRIGGIILHFDGATWMEMDRPMKTELYGIWGASSSDIYAVGDSVLHYDGARWSVSAEMGEAGLKSVWGDSKVDVFAVGAPNLIYHFDGEKWTSAEGGKQEGFFRSAPGVWRRDAPEMLAGFSAVWGASPSSIFATGHLTRSASPVSIVLHYDGAKWAPIRDERFVQMAGGVWGTSGSDVFVVGDGIEHFDGSSWHVMRTETDAEFVWPFFEGRRGGYVGRARLTAVWGTSSSDVFAVGDARAMFRPKGSLILHYDGDEPWREMSAGTRTELRGIWGSGPTDVFAVGAFGTILHYEGESCLPLR